MILKAAKVTGKEKIEVVETELPILKDTHTNKSSYGLRNMFH